LERGVLQGRNVKNIYSKWVVSILFPIHRDRGWVPRYGS
jgi:hypothetical protein